MCAARRSEQSRRHYRAMAQPADGGKTSREPDTCRYCALGCTGKHLRHVRSDPQCKLFGVPPRQVANTVQTVEAPTEGEDGPTNEGAAPSSSKSTAVRKPDVDVEKPDIRGSSTSFEEEPSSSASTTSDEADPLRGEPRGCQICRRLVRAFYRGQWESLETSSKRFYVEEEAPAEGNFVRLSTAQTRKLVTQFMECAYYSLMTLRIYGGETHFQALCEHLRAQPLQARDIWTACRIRYHEQLEVTGDEIRALLVGRHLPLPDVATAEGDMIFETPLAQLHAATPGATGGGSTMIPPSSLTTGTMPSSAVAEEMQDKQAATSPTTGAEEAQDWDEPRGYADGARSRRR